MRVSTKAIYGFRFMINLAFRYQEGVLQIKEVAEKEKISVKYLENLASLLKSSGLVKVERGIKGGYYLSRKPKDINAREIMEALEGDLNLIDRQGGDTPAFKEPAERGVMVDFWKDFSKHIKTYLENISLEDLKAYYKKENQMMYYI